jgi:hypothetical protein
MDPEMKRHKEQDGKQVNRISGPFGLIQSGLKKIQLQALLSRRKTLPSAKAGNLLDVARTQPQPTRRFEDLIYQIPQD